MRKRIGFKNILAFICISVFSACGHGNTQNANKLQVNRIVKEDSTNNSATKKSTTGNVNVIDWQFVDVTQILNSIRIVGKSAIKDSDTGQLKKIKVQFIGDTIIFNDTIKAVFTEGIMETTKNFGKGTPALSSLAQRNLGGKIRQVCNLLKQKNYYFWYDAVKAYKDEAAFVAELENIISVGVKWGHKGWVGYFRPKNYTKKL